MTSGSEESLPTLTGAQPTENAALSDQAYIKPPVREQKTTSIPDVSTSTNNLESHLNENQIGGITLMEAQKSTAIGLSDERDSPGITETAGYLSYPDIEVDSDVCILCLEPKSEP